MKKLLQKFNEPFPDRGSFGAILKSMLGIALFVTLFLFVLKPFGIRGVGDNLFWICLGFGGITFVFGLVFDVVMRFVLRIRTDVPTFTLGKWLLQAALLLLWIALGNYAYLQWLSGGGWNWGGALFMLWNTFLVGIFPLAFSGLMVQLNAIKKNQGIASSIATGSQKKQETDNNLKAPGSELLYAEAMQNYVALYHKKDGSVAKTVERNTLQNTLEALDAPSVIRCHRSYLVNLDAVVEVNGNAQGLRLRLSDTDTVIPVSRSYIEEIKSRLH